MTKLSRVQKERLLCIVVMTLLLGVILYQMIIMPSREVIRIRSGLLRDWQLAEGDGKNQNDVLARLNGEFEAANDKIRQCETSIATGDPYRWLMKTLPNFYEADPVDLLNYEPPQTTDWHIYPKVPYRAVTFVVSGTAYYHDLGKLLVALENSHPYLRIKRLDLEPKHSADPDDKEDEKLTFRLEFASMLKPSISLVPSDPAPTQRTTRK